MNRRYGQVNHRSSRDTVIARDDRDVSTTDRRRRLMRAAVVRAGSAGAEVVEVPDPTPGPGQALVRSLACGICGSDLHFADVVRSTPADPPGTTAPGVVLGHEFCVEVVDHGPGGHRGLPSGTLACAVPYVTTVAGPEMVGFSTTAPGAFADYLLVDADKLVAVPAGMPPEAAALTEPLAVGRHAAALGALEPGRPAVVVGCGPVGLAVLLALKAAGHGPVLVSDPSPERRAAAERLGADVVVDPGARSPFDWETLGVEPSVPSPLVGAAGRRAPVTVFECVGIPGLIQQILDGVPIGSRVVVVGVCMQPDTILPVTGVLKEVELVFSFAYRPDEFSAVLVDIGDGAIDTGRLITGTVDLGGVGDALDALATDPSEIKIVVQPG
jgi:2-desacetyl-2-hydroxyethyl bacteriochlorophyllide A dehydrogenase